MEATRGQAALLPNLTDNDWQWGRQPEQIEETIRNGRQAMMPPHGAVVGNDGVAQLARYVSNLSIGGQTGEGTEGHELFERYCAACHGRKGKPAFPSAADCSRCHEEEGLPSVF